MSKRLAMNTEGRLTYCSALDENIGKGRCNHLVHQNSNESSEDFCERCSNIPSEDDINKYWDERMSPSFNYNEYLDQQFHKEMSEKAERIGDCWVPKNASPELKEFARNVHSFNAVNDPKLKELGVKIAGHFGEEVDINNISENKEIVSCTNKMDWEVRTPSFHSYDEDVSAADKNQTRVYAAEINKSIKSIFNGEDFLIIDP